LHGSRWGPTWYSTTLAQLDAQIDNQAQIAKGQMLQSNLATGEASYGEGVGYETDGGQAQAAAYRNAVTDVNNNLSNALQDHHNGSGADGGRHQFGNTRATPRFPRR
jgi:hypothetical protein